jgi:predicted dehydrogenase
MSSPDTYGFGIIGTGMIAEFHAWAITSIERARLVSVYSRSEDRARAFAAKVGGKPCWDLDAFFSDRELDVVTICTPSGFHLEPTVAAAKYGKHVICEKPLEVTLDRIDQMIDAHKQSGTQLGAIFNSRYEPVNQALKKLIGTGRLGRITYGGGYVPWWRPQQYYDQGGWKGTRKYDGGGALMNQGTHTVDLLQWLMGEKVKRVSAFTALLGHTGLEVEDTAAAALQFEGGALGVLFATTAMQPGLKARVEIAGTGGTLISESTSLKFLKFSEPLPADEELVRQFGTPAASGGSADPRAISTGNHRRNFEAFIRALDTRTDPELDGKEARKAVQIVLAVYESARTGRAVELD